MAAARMAGRGSTEALEQRRAPGGGRRRSSRAHDRGAGIEGRDRRAEVAIAAGRAQRLEIVGVPDAGKARRGQRAHGRVGVAEQAREHRPLRRARGRDQSQQRAPPQRRVGGGEAFERDRFEGGPSFARGETVQVGKQARLPLFTRQRAESGDHAIERSTGARQTMAGPGRDLVVAVEEEQIEKNQGFLDQETTRGERGGAPHPRIGVGRELVEDRQRARVRHPGQCHGELDSPLGVRLAQQAADRERLVELPIDQQQEERRLLEAGRGDVRRRQARGRRRPARSGSGLPGALVEEQPLPRPAAMTASRTIERAWLRIIDGAHR